MITIKQLTKQEYENISKTQKTQISFFKNESDILKIVSLQLAQNIEQNIDILKMLLLYKEAEVIEIKTEQGVLHLVRNNSVK